VVQRQLRELVDVAREEVEHSGVSSLGHCELRLREKQKFCLIRKIVDEGEIIQQQMAVRIDPQNSLITPQCFLISKTVLINYK
jgi:hypothetical protein